MKSAIGSGLSARASPAMTIGSLSRRSADRIGTPARSSIVRTFVTHSSYASEKPRMSKSPIAQRLSQPNSGTDSLRMTASASGRGQYVRSAATPGVSLSIW